MKKLLFSALFCALAFLNISAQSDRIFATTDKESAEKIRDEFPGQVNILSTKNNSAAIKITSEAAQHLREFVKTHGPGFVYKPTAEAAVSAISQPKINKSILSFTITEDALVNAAINEVNAETIKDHIQELQDYGIRKHNTTQAQNAANDLKAKWEGWIAATGRTDISVRLVNHIGTPMPSVILTITGAENPDEYVIAGGHLDSFTWSGLAPGADDDASGIATISEIIRVLLNRNYVPSKTVEFMAFAAEEIGLVGSGEIAEEYISENKNVVAYVQFDMTNYKGSSKDVYLATDSYVSTDLNIFLIELMEHYNASGTHAFTYGNTICNYGCSDHYSWAEQGYNAAFPFESSFNDSNPYIHSTQDTLANMDNSAGHAAKFAKLGLEYIIETAKSVTLGTSDMQHASMQFFIDQKMLHYDLKNERAENLQIIDISGRTVLQQKLFLSKGSVDVGMLKKGIYLAVFKTADGKIQTKKFLID